MISGAILALLSSTSAVGLKRDPDVYGPNGDGYENDSADYDLSRIGIDIQMKGKGKKCSEGDWTTVAWKAYLKDGRLVSSSSEEADNRPKTFALGNADAFKCWELAIPSLKKGTKARLSCPSDLAWGGAHTPAPVGGEEIPIHSDIDFDIEILDCNRTPDHKIKEEVQPRTTTMQPNSCMYLHLEEGDHTGYDLVLSTEEEDFSEFWPAKYAMLEQKVLDDPAQQWYWNEKDGTLHNAANKDYFLQNDLGWVMVAKDTGSKKPSKDEEEESD